MAQYFCEKLKLRKEALKMAYICTVTGKICPMVKYSVSGEASPSVLFQKKGCGLNKKEEVQPIKEEVKEEIVEEKVEIKEEVIEVVEEEIKEKVDSEQKSNTPKQNNYKKKKKNQNRNQEQKQ